MRSSKKITLREAKAQLIGDSIDRRKQVEKLIELVREDERAKVMEIKERALANRE